MNFVQNSFIRQALRLSVTVNSREEIYIPLYKLKTHIERLRINEYDFRAYLYRYAPDDEYHYINEVVQKLYHTDIADINKQETFRIISGLL